MLSSSYSIGLSSNAAERKKILNSFCCLFPFFSLQHFSSLFFPQRELKICRMKRSFGEDQYGFLVSHANVSHYNMWFMRSYLTLFLSPPQHFLLSLSPSLNIFYSLSLSLSLSPTLPNTHSLSFNLLFFSVYLYYKFNLIFISY
jgi:hypothetical protein